MSYRPKVNTERNSHYNRLFDACSGRLRFRDPHCINRIPNPLAEPEVAECPCAPGCPTTPSGIPLYLFTKSPTNEEITHATFSYHSSASGLSGEIDLEILDVVNEREASFDTTPLIPLGWSINCLDVTLVDPVCYCAPCDSPPTIKLTESDCRPELVDDTVAHVLEVCAGDLLDISVDGVALGLANGPYTLDAAGAALLQADLIVTYPDATVVEFEKECSDPVVTCLRITITAEGYHAVSGIGTAIEQTLTHSCLAPANPGTSPECTFECPAVNAP